MNKKHEDEDLEMSKMGLVDGEIHQDKDKVTGDPPKPQTTASRIIDMACILLNIASTVTLVFLNKWYDCRQFAHPYLGLEVPAGGQWLTVFHSGSSETFN